MSSCYKFPEKLWAYYEQFHLFQSVVSENKYVVPELGGCCKMSDVTNQNVKPISKILLLRIEPDLSRSAGERLQVSNVFTHFLGPEEKKIEERRSFWWV